MKEFIEKLIERLKSLQQYYIYSVDDLVRLGEVEKTVNQLAEEYKDKTNDAWKTVYDKVCNLEKEYAIKNNTESINDCIRLENLLQYFKDELRSTEEHKGGWIPCSERLPEDNKKVLVSYEDRYIGGYYSVCAGYYIHKLNQWDIEEQSNEEDFKVFAWMPYPEPFKPKGE